MEKLGTTVIPAFQVETQEEADALIAWLADNSINEGFVMSPYSELIQAVKQKRSGCAAYWTGPNSPPIL